MNARLSILLNVDSQPKMIGHDKTITAYLRIGSDILTNKEAFIGVGINGLEAVWNKLDEDRSEIESVLHQHQEQDGGKEDE